MKIFNPESKVIVPAVCGTLLSILSQMDALRAESTDPAMTWEELDIIRLRAIELQVAMAKAA